MGRMLKRGKAGNAVQYLTRTKAIRKLQLRLSEFRRLCILKGIHPREPKKKVHGANKTYYHVKDINWLMHEPLLQVFRNMKAHERKVRKAKGKFNPELAARLKQLTPTYRLDHLVKERYPSFVDALRDLDDALTMVHLFATLPGEKRLGIPVKVVETAHRLALEWSAWVVRSSALRKVFVSVKGIYFQAEVMGQAVTWLVPHQLAQVLPLDVDYKVMITFLEFYETLLQFVNFKLYHNLGLKYPPVLQPGQLEKEALALAAVMRQLAGVHQEDMQQADAAVQALKRSDDEAAAAAAASKGKAGKAAAGNDAQVTARLKGLDAAKIAELAGAVDEQPDGDADEEEEEHDSEAGEEEDDDEDLPEIDSQGSDDDDDDDEDEEDVEEEGQEAQLGERRRSSLLAGPSDGAVAMEEDGAEDDGEKVAGGALGHTVSVDDDAAVCASLFKGLVIFLAREVPREPLALVIRSFGGVAAWDGEGSPHVMTDEAVTHHVVDRPTQGHKFLSRHYIQPQWIFDSANFRVLMPASLYAPGKAPPPHLSPFVNDDEEGYTPDFALQVKKLQEVAKAARARASGVVAEGFAEEAQQAADEAQQAELALTSGEAAADVHEAELAHQRDLVKELQAATAAAGGEEGEEQQPQKGGKRRRGAASEDEPDAEEEDDDDEEASEEEEDAQLEGGEAVVKRQREVARKRAEQDKADESLLKDVMMTRRNRKLYERINRAVEGKRERVQVLEDRKVALQKKQPQTPQPSAGKKAAGRPAKRAK